MKYYVEWNRHPFLLLLLQTAGHFTARLLSVSWKDGTSAAGTRERSEREAERLLDHYGNSILRLAYSYLHNREDAEEILQDTILQFLKTAPALESLEHEKAWLLRVAANLSKNRQKYNTLRRTDELAEDREELSFVWEAVRRLPSNYRETIHLFYLEGYSTREIARILNQKEATVRSHLQRGREKLKAILGEAYDFNENV